MKSLKLGNFIPVKELGDELHVNGCGLSMNETCIKHFVPDLVGPRKFDAYVVTCFAFLLSLMVRLSRSCGENM